MADSKLTALSFGSTPDFFYGSEGGVSKKYSGTNILNVKDFGAAGDGSNNDTSAIQAALDAAALVNFSGGQAQGATVYFPAGVYMVTASLKDPSGNGLTPTSAVIRLVGEGAGNGCSASVIRGVAVAGYTLDVPDLWPNFTRENSHAYLGGCMVNWSSGAPTVWSCLRPGTTAGSEPSIAGKVVGDTVTDGSVTWKLLSLTQNAATNINGLEHLEIDNTSTTAGDGAFRIDRMASIVVKQCRFSGFNALHASGNAFGASFIGCAFNSPTSNGAAGSYGCIVGQSSYHGCTLSGFDIGLAHYGSDLHIFDCHIENSNLALLLGMDPRGTTSPSHGPTIVGNSFENNNTCLRIASASNASILSNSFTGVVAVDHFNVTLTGTTTNLSAIVTGLSSTAGLAAGNIATSASGLASLSNILSVDSGTQVTLTKAATASGSRSILFQNTVTAGIVIDGELSGALVAANSVGMAATNAGVDLTSSNCTTVVFMANVVNCVNSNGSGSDWKLPTSYDRKAGVTYITGDNPTAAMAFASLPGQPGVISTLVTEGMQFDITDAALQTVGTGSACSIAATVLTVGGTIGGQGFSIGDTLSGTGVTSGTKILSYASATTYNVTPSQTAGSTTITASNIPFGAIVTAGGSTRVRVRYNGTNWIRTG